MMNTTASALARIESKLSQAQAVLALASENDTPIAGPLSDLLSGLVYAASLDVKMLDEEAEARAASDSTY